MPPPAGPSQLVAYKLLRFAAIIFEDQEKVREQAENRLRQFTRDEDDADGVRRGLGLTADDPSVRELAALVSRMLCDSKVVVALGLRRATGLTLRHVATGLRVEAGSPADAARLAETGDFARERSREGCCLEHDAERNLIMELRRTPFAGFAAEVPGVGDKTLARLLGATGDPYLRLLPDNKSIPRTLAQWRAYCGYGDPGRRPFKGMTKEDAQRLGNREAKKRAYIIAEQMVKQNGKPDKNGKARARSPYRDLYDAAKEAYIANPRIHVRECRNTSRVSPNGCGTREHPEWGEIGSPWRDGHAAQAALRLVTKQFLDDLYAEAKRIHEGG